MWDVSGTGPEGGPIPETGPPGTPKPCVSQTHLLHDVLGLLGDPAGIVWRVHPDGLKEFILIITMEGRLTNEHLIEEDPKGPPVHRECVLQALQDLRATVVRVGNQPSLGSLHDSTLPWSSA